MPKFILSPQHPVGFHRFSDCFFIFRLSGRIQSPYLFRLNVRDLLQLRRIRFRAVLCFSRAALLICSESDTSLNNYNKHEDDSYVEKTLPVLDFIQLLIQHIPEKHFKITRYYGLYARRRELDKTIRKAVDPCKHKIILDWNQWRNLIFLSFGYDPLECPKCKHKMVFMELYQKHKRVPLEELYEKAMAPYRCQSKGPPGKCA